MAKEKSKKAEEVVETKAEVVAEAPVAKAKIEYPEGDAKGKFHAVEFNGGYVVYNPAGQRATGVIEKIKADDIVRANNQAAHIK